MRQGVVAVRAVPRAEALAAPGVLVAAVAAPAATSSCSSAQRVTLPDGTALEVLSAVPAPASAGPTSLPSPPPLLFVHGSAHAAWCWADHFLPWFAERGWPAHAVSLRGRGRSGPPPPGAKAGGTLASHAADLAAVVGAGGVDAHAAGIERAGAATDGGRAARYRHYARHNFDFNEAQFAVICELLLRGRQQPGELRTRASRMVRVDSQEQLRADLQSLQEKGFVQSNGGLERRGGSGAVPHRTRRAAARRGGGR